MATMCADDFVRTIEFIRGSHAAIVGDTILSGIKVARGVLIYDQARLQFPGDRLHEAGHLAVKSPEDRKLAGDNLSGDPAEEMMAIG